jgi:hypothetical protein
MKWVTREYVHADRTACPWLIRKFVDPKAEFIFVSPDKIENTVKKEKATPFDTQGAELGHHGEKCSFDAIIAEYGLSDPAVLELANIVRAADTDKADIAEEGAGLSAIMTGLSITSRNDQETVEKAAPAYEALFDFCRLRILQNEAKDELEKMDKKTCRESLRKKLMQTKNNKNKP